jgi:hypothetical protein
VPEEREREFEKEKTKTKGKTRDKISLVVLCSTGWGRLHH